MDATRLKLGSNFTERKEPNGLQAVRTVGGRLIPTVPPSRPPLFPVALQHRAYSVPRFAACLFSTSTRSRPRPAGKSSRCLLASINLAPGEGKKKVPHETSDYRLARLRSVCRRPNS